MCMTEQDIYKNFDELNQIHRSLVIYWNGQVYVIEGDLKFRANYNGTEIEDKYRIKIEVPPSFPNKVPLVQEIGGRIPETFHKNNRKYLCLEVETKLQLSILQNPKLIYFVNKFVVEYLYSWSFKEMYGRLPYGERPHGVPGIIEYYKELFGVSEDIIILKALRVIGWNTYRGHHDCFCGSMKKTRKCHGHQLIQLINLNVFERYKKDFDSIYSYIKSKIANRKNKN